ncbi:hypothetical protein HBHAL_4288 [Halobacillus halophilus DSM 2266]|uniref:Uncharacterized protein n=1 Tax=Halobacillus halophilus (strain ATCC 35676 / DSM 2266 / JCM 20832 / KCTC 3685 / LMG 17431 / NBRC 102448 / NCIMB 2269) TaxID=866895 RepID=I0JR59_HALH3|nr:hypothetical protein HBHAL_4288 [Halobacillus halophilus DSM 2266]
MPQNKTDETQNMPPQVIQKMDDLRWHILGGYYETFQCVKSLVHGIYYDSRRNKIWNR